MLEPRPEVRNQAERSIAPGAADLFLVPGVAFDRWGNRVGYGGGFYDRLFRRTRPDALRVAIGAAVQLVDGRLPGGAFDLPVHAVVTPAGVVRVVTAGPEPG